MVAWEVEGFSQHSSAPKQYICWVSLTLVWIDAIFLGISAVFGWWTGSDRAPILACPSCALGLLSPKLWWMVPSCLSWRRVDCQMWETTQVTFCCLVAVATQPNLSGLWLPCGILGFHWKKAVIHFFGFDCNQAYSTLLFRAHLDYFEGDKCLLEWWVSPTFFFLSLRSFMIFLTLLGMSLSSFSYNFNAASTKLRLGSNPYIGSGMW